MYTISRRINRKRYKLSHLSADLCYVGNSVSLLLTNVYKK